MTTAYGLGPIKNDILSRKNKQCESDICGAGWTMPNRRAPIQVDRVKARLDELKFPVTAVATSAGLERNFVNDIIAGRKQKMNASNLRNCTQIKLLRNQQIGFEGPMNGDRDVEGQAVAVKKLS